MIALLPCKHSLHDGCYSEWIQSTAYPSPLELLCPLCRRGAQAVGLVFSAADTGGAVEEKEEDVSAPLPETLV